MEPDGRPTLPIDSALDELSRMYGRIERTYDFLIDLALMYPDFRDGLEMVASRLKA